MAPESGWIRIGDIPAYRAQPEDAGPFPVVLVVQEIAVAPELYARQGDVSGLQEHNQIREVVARVPDAQVMSDLDAAVAWANASGVGDTSRLALTGFCWGGRIAWLYAVHSDRLKATVAWYGRVESAPTPLQPRSPLDVAGVLLGLYGPQDRRTRRDRDLPQRRTRLFRRLPAQLPTGRRGRRMAAPVELV
jgi:carboxymethylenebutenolidase